jgi:CheY-like chemotaxis protein
MKKILVIDDEEQIRLLIKVILSKEGYNVDVAENGLIGLEMINDGSYDVIITDLLMPEKEGLETIREIMMANPETKIIAISGGGLKGDLDFLEIAKLFGAKVTLSKPFTKRQLLSALESL